MSPFTRSFLLLLLFLTGQNLHSQQWTWAKGEGGIGNDASESIALDEQGNAYITGNIAGMAEFSGTNYQGEGLYDMYVAKYDAQGNLVWVKLAGGIGNDQGNSIKCVNGYLYVAGYFEDTIRFGSLASIIAKGGTDAFVAKYDLNGNLIWAKGGGGTSSDLGTSVDVDGSGNVYLAGQYQYAINFDGTQLHTSNIYNESFYCKYSQDGNLIWAHSVTGTGTNLITGVAFDKHSSIYLTGFFGNSLEFDSTTVNSATSSYDVFLAKVNDNGSLEWLKRAGSTYEDEAMAVCSDRFGNAIVTGYFAGTAAFDQDTVRYIDYDDVFVAKYDSSGHNLWVKAGNGHQVDIGFSVTTDNIGNIFVTGMFQGGIDFDGHTLTGQDREIFVASYNPYGRVRWVDKAGGVQTDCGLGIAVGGSGTVAISGYYLHTCYFGNIEIDIADYNDLFIAEYNPPIINDGNSIFEAGNDLPAFLNPNPVKSGSFITLATPGFSGETTITVANLLGKIITQHSFRSQLQLAVDDWAPGIYFIDFAADNKRSTLKVVVQ